ncbi:hypothetical protein IU498_06405 [Nocardia beijingensis]|uniref:hypothetical protein n=1 Tax=Nocardia beijingensis TaxID=95162 RepID=UPI0018935F8D|nr:hypothetical protein [Nocardia beijingensis]MBF6074262.1 hypothetical protein [Nocardia beijingensis]
MTEHSNVEQLGQAHAAPVLDSLSLHLVNVVLDAVTEAFAEMVEIAQLHRDVAPEQAEAVEFLAAALMDVIRDWLRGVIR